MKWWARHIIKDRILVHLRKREIVLYQRNQLWGHDKYYDKLWHEAGCHLRCADRLNKLLDRYK